MNVDRVRRVLSCGALWLLCSCVYGPSKVAQGQLYKTGNPSYDGFFHDVHQQQVDASGWGDDKRDAHKALVAQLQLTPDAADVTIVQATHEASSKMVKQAGSVRLDVEGTQAHVNVAGGASGDAASLFHAVEDTSHMELERARKLRSVEPRLDALTKQGNDLSAKVKADFGKYGQTRANEVATEVLASLDAVAALKSHAEAEARESEDFVADLERALETASEDRAAKATRRKRRRDEGLPKGATLASDQPAAAPPEKKAAPPSPPPPPPEKKAEPEKKEQPGEVFNP